MKLLIRSIPPPGKLLLRFKTDIWKKQKITAVLALHDREETLRLAQDVSVMNSGKSCKRNNSRNIQSTGLWVCGSLCRNGIDTGRHRQQLRRRPYGHFYQWKINRSGWWCSIGQKVYCCLRPENVTYPARRRAKSARAIFWRQSFQNYPPGIFL